ncbi:acyltransferase [Caulobacter sp. X]|uniref:acyltransferase family protein n=1 Tax=Caulobacter sp. X TaxID=2048901 RepID=UPI000C1584F7|nr:acyltransferase [Caulobacter sp. X]PIB95639.1 hypothetical protein CSW60_13685 [Caulobacter sp. X]
MDASYSRGDLNAPRQHLSAARLVWIDGLRALSILAVMMFHYYVRWTPPLHGESLYPYGSAYAHVAPFLYGYMGVRLFFIISGFVIAYSLARSSGIIDFAARRYARLFPAMLLCASITYVSSVTFPYSISTPSPGDFIPSVIFIEPGLINKFQRFANVSSIDGSYWSLYVEVKFYLIIAISYFASARMMPLIISAISMICVVIYCAGVSFSDTFENLLFASSWPWFLMGIGLYVTYGAGRRYLGWGLILVALIELALLSFRDGGPSTLLFGVGGVALFWFGFRSEAVRRVLTLPALSLIGLASYPLYLLHQNVGVQAIRMMDSLMPGSRWSALFPVVVSVFMIAASIGIYFLVERPVQRVLSKPLSRLSALTNRFKARSAGG